MGSPWALRATKAGGDKGGYEKAPPGNHPAVLVALVDMGTQTVDGYNGGPPKQQHRSYFVWELTAERAAGTSRNHVIGHDLNLSLNENSTLTKWVTAWTGRPIRENDDFNVSTLLGKACLLNVVEKNGWPKVDGVSAMPRGVTAPPPGYSPVAVTLDEMLAGATPPDWLPWLFGRPILDHVRESAEWKAAGLPGGPLPPPPPAAPPAPRVSTPAAGPSATPPPPRRTPPPPPPPAPVDRVWSLTVSADADPVEVPESRIKAMWEAEGLASAKDAMVWDGTSWVPITEAIPAAKNWIPF